MVASWQGGRRSAHWEGAFEEDNAVRGSPGRPQWIRLSAHPISPDMKVLPVCGASTRVILIPRLMLKPSSS